MNTRGARNQVHECAHQDDHKCSHLECSAGPLCITQLSQTRGARANMRAGTLGHRKCDRKLQVEVNCWGRAANQARRRLRAGPIAGSCLGGRRRVLGARETRYGHEIGPDGAARERERLRQSSKPLMSAHRTERSRGASHWRSVPRPKFETLARFVARARAIH